ncbi:MAG TPA: hypothetical protein VD994_00975, partial [Prosthecobacter sp.]|nr:hypothetical protein [Prosthecobacter sp.]
MNSKENWVAIMYGAKADPSNDSQAGAADTDIVGDSSHGSFYTAFDGNGTATAADDTLLFRLRIGNPTSATSFDGVGVVGMDVNSDGRIDLYVAIDGRKSNSSVLLMDPGSEANSSPSTMSNTFLPKG